MCWPTRARKCTECRGLGRIRRVELRGDAPVRWERVPADRPPPQVTRPRVVAVSAAIVHPEERIDPVTRVAEPAAKSARRFPVDFGGHRAVAGALAAAVAIVAVMAFSAAVMVPGPGSPQRASPGPVLGVANPTGSADADSTPQRIGAPESSGSATLPPTGGTGPGRLETTAERLSVWEDKFGEVRVQVIVTARNAGGAPLVVATSAASWSILDEAGDVTARGRFTHAFPGVVAPGGEVYFIDGVSAAFAQPADLAELNVLIPSEAMVDDGTIVRLETSEVSWMAARRRWSGGIRRSQQCFDRDRDRCDGRDRAQGRPGSGPRRGVQRQCWGPGTRGDAPVRDRVSRHATDRPGCRGQRRGRGKRGGRGGRSAVTPGDHLHAARRPQPASRRSITWLVRRPVEELAYPRVVRGALGVGRRGQPAPATLRDDVR